MSPLTWIHVLGGSVALLSGAAALAMPKGGRLHAKAGTAFFGSMLIMAGTGAIMAALKPERGTAVIGLLTCYLVMTSWVTARRRDGGTAGFEKLAFGLAAAIAIAMLGLGLIGAASTNGRVDSLPAAVHFVFAAVAALAAALDLNFILRGPVSRKQRIARHLWRMCAALLIAAFSFFLGQQKVMPASIQGSPFLFAPPLAVLAAMIFWIVRVRFSRRFGGARPDKAVARDTPIRLAQEQA